MFSKWTLFKYFFFQNRYAWKAISEEEQRAILKANIYHNNERMDYKNPDLYQGGKNYNSEEDRTVEYTGQVLDDVLKAYKPESVLEIGPGAGFHTRQIIESPEVKEYTAVDIVKPFLDFLKKNIKSDIKTTFKLGDIRTMDMDGKKYDLILFLSSLHHIPDREDFVNSLMRFMHKDSKLLFVEPCHYLLRIYKLIRRSPLYLSKKFAHHDNYRNLSTHHHLTIREFMSFKNFEVVDYGYNYVKRFKLKPNKNPITKYLSHRMFCLLRLKKDRL